LSIIFLDEQKNRDNWLEWIKPEEKPETLQYVVTNNLPSRIQKLLNAGFF